MREFCVGGGECRALSSIEGVERFLGKIQTRTTGAVTTALANFNEVFNEVAISAWAFSGLKVLWL